MVLSAGKQAVRLVNPTCGTLLYADRPAGSRQVILYQSLRRSGIPPVESSSNLRKDLV
jgi:hypothetical protein